VLRHVTLSAISSFVFVLSTEQLKDTYDLFDLDKYEASYVLQRENDAKAIAAQEEEEKPSLARFMNRLLSRLT
jgi:hypothetical protein